MIKSVASLINIGAHHMVNKNYDEAITSFLSCMKVTKQMLRQMEMGMAAGTKKKLSCRDTVASKDFGYEFLHVDSCDMPSVENSFVFKKVVVVTSCTSSNADDDAVMSVLVYLAVISVYNLALAHHLSGLERQCRQRLERARNYYELSYKLQSQESAAGFGLLHSLSVLNNIGAICSVLNEREASEKFFSKLLTALTYLRENGDAAQIQNSWNGFWSNAVTSIICNPSAAGAA
jgi:hypothetical protein